MILQQLHHYYTRQQKHDPGLLPEYGWEKRELHFTIVLDQQGNFVQLKDLRQPDGKFLRGRSTNLPAAVKRTVGISANLLWDNIGYVLGYDTKGKPERAAKQFVAFINVLETRAPKDAPAIKAILHFLRNDPLPQVQADQHWQELLDANANISFELQNQIGLVVEQPEVAERLVLSEPNPDAASLQCLITGEIQPVATLHPNIKGVRGAQTAGANIVSFNLSAFRSYGKAQGANAPVSVQAAFTYTTALNHLLGKDSRQKLQISDASTVFWAQQPHPLENNLIPLFDVDYSQDDPDAHADKIRSLYAAPMNGVVPDKDDCTPFYVLGLAPNAARISIRYWHATTVGELSTNIGQYFDDLKIIAPPKAENPPRLKWLLRSLALQGKDDNIPPNLAGEFMRAVLTGQRYPQTLLTAALGRMRAEQRITFERAALIKAVLTRNYQETINVALDIHNSNQGYRLGRLFAVLERFQEQANPGINTTIVDSHFGAASSTPVTVFSRLLRLKQHHLAKIRKSMPGMAVNLEKLLTEVVGQINDFPPTLPLAAQGQFALGYYHQRQDFFTKKTATTTTDSGDE